MDGVLGSFPGLGSVTMYAFIISGGNVASVAAFVKTACICGASVLLNTLKYSLEKLSSTGDLPFGKVAMTD